MDECKLYTSADLVKAFEKEYGKLTLSAKAFLQGYNDMTYAEIESKFGTNVSQHLPKE
jgi:hypothetical protein